MATLRRGSLIAVLAVVGVLTVQEVAIAPRFGGHPGVFLLMYDGILGGLYAAGLSLGRALGRRALSVVHKTGASIEMKRSRVVAWVAHLTTLGVGLAAVVGCFYFASASSTEVRVGYLGDRHRCGSPLYPNTTGCGSVAAAGLLVMLAGLVAMIAGGYALAVAQGQIRGGRFVPPRSVSAIAVVSGLAMLTLAAWWMRPERPLVPTAVDDVEVVAFARDIRVGTMPLVAGVAVLVTVAMALGSKPRGIPWVSSVLVVLLSAVVGLVLAVSWTFLVLGFVMSQ